MFRMYGTYFLLSLAFERCIPLKKNDLICQRSARILCFKEAYYMPKECMNPVLTLKNPRIESIAFALCLV